MRVKFTVAVGEGSRQESFDIAELVPNWAKLEISELENALRKAWQGWVLQSINGGVEVIQQRFQIKSLRYPND